MTGFGGASVSGWHRRSPGGTGWVLLEHRGWLSACFIWYRWGAGVVTRGSGWLCFWLIVFK